VNLQRIIGLTGGIATGKSTVVRHLAGFYQLPILDADIYAREAITPEFLKILEDRYGSKILQSDRTLDRSQLARIVFNNLQEKVWLEQQIHPYVRKRLKIEAHSHSPRPVVMVIPLLFEVKMQDLVTETWVVGCSPDQELQRLMARDRLNSEAAQLRIDQQMPIMQKFAIADFRLDNSGTILDLYKQVDLLMSPNC
jgi:dephospho-CoA kinase